MAIMEKIFCKDCKYICKPSGASYTPHPLSICMCEEYSILNYVTGEREHRDCKDININGECNGYVRDIGTKININEY